MCALRVIRIYWAIVSEGAREQRKMHVSKNDSYYLSDVGSFVHNQTYTDDVSISISVCATAKVIGRARSTHAHSRKKGKITRKRKGKKKESHTAHYVQLLRKK